MEKITIHHVADYFLEKESMTPKKLQKLVYYAYCWFIALANEDKDDIYIRLFDESPEAWIHGPTFPSLFRKYKAYTADKIEKREKGEYKFNEDTIDILEQVWEVYGSYSETELEDLARNEGPWLKARKALYFMEPSNKKLDDKDIFIYYVAKMN